MAKKTTKQTGTIADSLTAVGERFLSKNPHFKSVFVTSDGVAFASENAAQNHAAKLKDNIVVEVQKPAEADSATAATEKGDAAE